MTASQSSTTEAATREDADADGVAFVERPVTNERKPYEKPALQRLGSVKDLTFATRMTPFSDGGGRRSM